MSESALVALILGGMVVGGFLACAGILLAVRITESQDSRS